MKVRGEKSFDRDVDRLTDKRTLRKLMDVLTQIENAASLMEIRDCKKIQGYEV